MTHLGRPRLGASEKARRILEADERNLAWASLSPAEKIQSLERRRGESKRQLLKLRAIGGKG